MTRPIGYISWPLFKKIVDQTCSTAEVYNLFGLGEPLFHRQLFKMIDYCQQKKAAVVISTNATLLDKDKINQLIAHPPDYLLFALDAQTRKTYQKIRGGNNFNQVRTNIDNYLKKKKERKVPTFAVLLFVKQEINKHEVKAFKKYWRNKGAAIYIKPVTQMTKLTPRSQPSKRCLFPWRTLNITWQGDVYPCCQDTNCEFRLGNLKKQSIKEIWNGSQWQKLRLSFKNNKLDALCQSCQVYRPSLLTTIGLSLFNELTIKKVVPFLKSR
jgi:radical SAM protein with 4Fe4S-binding SPASM domain